MGNVESYIVTAMALGLANVVFLACCAVWVAKKSRPTQSLCPSCGFANNLRGIIVPEKRSGHAESRNGAFAPSVGDPCIVNGRRCECVAKVPGGYVVMFNNYECLLVTKMEITAAPDHLRPVE
jgi:hypothetical protein